MTETVELGAGRRWPFVVGAGVVAWIALAATVGGGAGDDAEAPQASPSTAATTTVTVEEARTPMTLFASGSTGLHLVLEPGALLDLDTGVLAELPYDAVVAYRPDGVFTRDGGVLAWRPFPFADAAAVDLGDGQLGTSVHPVPLADDAWVVRNDGSAQLVSLLDGSTSATASIPEGAHDLGAVPGGGLVVGAGGDTFVIGADGSTTELDGSPVLVSDDAVFVHECDGELSCAVRGHDLGSGAVVDVSELFAAFDVQPVAMHPDGRALVRLQSSPSDPGTYALLGPDGSITDVTPPDYSAASQTAAFSPDGSLLFVRRSTQLRVLRDGVEIAAFDLPYAIRGLRVLGPAG